MSYPINRDRALIDPVLLHRVDAVIKDVNAHLPSDRRLEIFEGWRNPRYQLQLYKAGFSRTLRSRHSLKPAAAVDVMFQDRWTDGTWHWLPWAMVDKQWLKWLISAKKAHGFYHSQLAWDKPHCQL